MDYLEKLAGMSRNQLMDHVEAIWRGEITITELERDILKERLLQLRMSAPEEFVMFYLVLYSLVEITQEAKENASPEDKKKLTPAQIAGGALVLYLFAELPKPIFEDEYEYIWVTKQDEKVCKICSPMHGKVVGENLITMGFKTHPECRCEIHKRLKTRRAMNKVWIREAGAVRALSEGQKRILEVLAAPFGSPERQDRYKQYFHRGTDFMVREGDRRPLLYFHGYSPRGRALKAPYSMGDAYVHKADSKGIWMRAELPPEGQDPLADATWTAALEGRAAASTGSIEYLVRPPAAKGKFPPGPVDVWPIAELSIFDRGDERIPVSDDAVVLPLRALFTERDIPYTFEAGEDKDEGDPAKRTLDTEEIMDKKTFDELYAEQKAKEQAEAEAKEAMRAEILEEIKSQPNYRATFNVNTIDDSKARKNADDEEEFAFFRGLLEDARRVAEGGMPARRAATSLEETEADELGDLVPDQLLNKLAPKLQEYSVVDKLASKGLMTIYKADRLTISIPQNVTHMTPLADIAEEGAYVQQVPTFDAKQATMQKVGNYVTVTEEALDDQTLFQSWFPGECARAIALAKNADLYALTNAIAGTDVATRSAITVGELIDCRYGIEQQYREKAVWLMNDATIAYLRGLRDANNFIYGDAGFAPWGGMGELGETILGKPVFANANWEDITGADAADKVIDFLNMDQAIFWAERQNLRIFVDPYSTRLAAGTINFLPMARYGGVVKDSEAMAGIDGKDA